MCFVATPAIRRFALLSRKNLIVPSAVALFALGGLIFQLRLPFRLPDESDYRQVQQALEAEGTDGDVVLLYPWWIERARLFVPTRIPVVGYQGSDADALEKHPRIWLLSQPGLPKADLDEFMKGFGARRTAIGGERVFGKLHLQLFKNDRHRPVRFDLVDLLPKANVYLENTDGAKEPCPFDGKIHRCSGGLYVASEWHELHFQPVKCLRMFPPGGQRKLVAEWNELPDATTVVLHGGYVWDRGFFHEPQFTSTTLTASINGSAASTMEFPPGREESQRSETPAIPTGATLRLSSQSANPELRELCVEAYGVGAPPS